MTEEAEADQLFRAAGIETGVAAVLARYALIVLEANRRFNLTGAKDASTLVPHVIDALTLAPYVESPLVDVGAGAGLPGMPLALACGIHVTFIEATAKKADFLEMAAAELGCDARVVCGRAEVLGHRDDLREGFACGTARAVGPPATALELTVPFLRIGGKGLMQRGAIEGVEEAAAAGAALILGCRVEDELMLDEGRRIAIVRKERSTPSRFPRRTGIPAKRPLCAHRFS